MVVVTLLLMRLLLLVLLLLVVLVVVVVVVVVVACLLWFVCLCKINRNEIIGLLAWGRSPVFGAASRGRRGA